MDLGLNDYNVEEAKFEILGLKDLGLKDLGLTEIRLQVDHNKDGLL